MAETFSDDDTLSDVENGQSTNDLARQAAASVGLGRAQDERALGEEVGQSKRRVRFGERPEVEVLQQPKRLRDAGLHNYTIPRIKNSSKFSKDKRPDHLQDDDIFDELTIGEATMQLAMWTQTKADREATELKMRKAEGKPLKSNTMVKMVKVSSGDDDATSTFHPQRFHLRPPVTGLSKVWASYPTHWPEVYYSMDFSDVGLENQLGQKQLELLHDRRSKIEIKMFAPANASWGRSGTKTMSVKQDEDGNTAVSNKDEWLGLLTMSELMLSLDNLVAAYACMWPNDRSMVTLRRVVTKNKEFSAMTNVSTRLKLLESFINEVLRINQRKAIQGDVPLTFKEANDMAKDYLDNVSDYVRESGNKWKESGQQGSGQQAGVQMGGGQGNRWLDRGQSNRWMNRGQGSKGNANVDNVTRMEEFTRKLLEGKSVNGRKVCVEYNMKDDRGGHRCKDRRCDKAHCCGFVDKGTDKVCGKKHSKFEHRN